MPCLPIIETSRSGKKRRVGFLCVGSEPVAVEYRRRTYLLEWTAASGYCPVNRDGTGRESPPPKAVWDLVDKLPRGDA